MRDIFSEGLLYLDLLEIYGSTYAVAEICGIAQSNVFRGANSCAKLLNLGLTKNKQSGSYQVERNLDVQRDLRKLNQRMRAREHGALRIIGAEALIADHDITLAQAKSYRSLPVNWHDISVSLDYLERSLLDVLIVRASQFSSHMAWPPPVRRRDLFIPLDPFACTELCSWPLVLAAGPTNPQIKLLSIHKACQLKWIADENLPLEHIRTLYPDTSIYSLQEIDATKEMALAQVQTDSDFIWLTDLRRFMTLKLQYPCLSLHQLDLDLGIQDYLLAITLIPLIREPMHQLLIRFLRELASSASVGKPVSC